MSTQQPEPNPHAQRPAGVPTSPPPPTVKEYLTVGSLYPDHIELITWIDASKEVPPNAQDVLVRIEKPGRVITWFGYYSHGLREWHDSDGFTSDVLFWAKIPEGPQ